MNYIKRIDLRHLYFLVVLILGAVLYHSHLSGQTMVVFSSAPSGACSPVTVAVDTSMHQLYYCDGSNWQHIHLVPAGMHAFVTSGTCPNGWTEDATLSGQWLQFTKAANSDVGTTGGSATITPTGTLDIHTTTTALLTGVGTTVLTGPATHTFTGAAIDPRYLYTKVIPCTKK